MNKNLILPTLGAAALIGGLAMTYVNLAAAQTQSTSSPQAEGQQHGQNGWHGHRGHAPLGNDGNVTAVSGTTITMREETDEGGASYAVDASGATFLKSGASATISDIKVGDKIFVDDMVSGTNVVATKVMDGHPGHGFGKLTAGGFGGPHTDKDHDQTSTATNSAQQQ